MSRKFLLALAMIVPTTLSPAAAQPEQTPEGAQRFIKLTSEIENKLLITVGSGGSVWASFFATTAKSPDPCTTIIEARVHQISAKNRGFWNLQPQQEKEAALAMLGIQPAPFTIDWRNVRLGEPSEYGSFSVGSNNRSFVMTSFHGDKDMLVRLRYAAEFLRNACDPTAGTGF